MAEPILIFEVVAASQHAAKAAEEDIDQQMLAVATLPPGIGNRLQLLHQST